MKCRKAYAIIPVGENDRSAHVAQQKAPEVATPGLFYSVLGGWLNPKAGYQLFFSVQLHGYMAVHCECVPVAS